LTVNLFSGLVKESDNTAGVDLVTLAETENEIAMSKQGTIGLFQPEFAADPLDIKRFQLFQIVAFEKDNSTHDSSW
jgi:hypothetical protein